MKLALVQPDLVWENPQANRERLSEMLQPVSADLFLLPEMFTSGFTMHPQAVAEIMEGETVAWMRAMALEKSAALTGSVVIQEDGVFYNRLLFVCPSGEVHHYDKRHLFTLAGEHLAYGKGNERLVVEYNGWRICPLVCYDLRFPVFSRNTQGFDLLLYVANWPAPRINAWDTLLPARAIENVCYVAGVNRVGQDANGHHYSGHAQVIDQAGHHVLSPQPAPGVYIATLDKTRLRDFRSRFAFLDDQDAFDIRD